MVRQRCAWRCEAGGGEGGEMTRYRRPGRPVDRRWAAPAIPALRPATLECLMAHRSSHSIPCLRSCLLMAAATALHFRCCREFDLDMGVDEADCAKYVALADAMKADGLILFKRGDYVAQKEKSVRTSRDADEVNAAESLWRDRHVSRLPAPLSSQLSSCSYGSPPVPCVCVQSSSRL